MLKCFRFQPYPKLPFCALMHGTERMTFESKNTKRNDTYRNFQLLQGKSIDIFKEILCCPMNFSRGKKENASFF